MNTDLHISNFDPPTPKIVPFSTEYTEMYDVYYPLNHGCVCVHAQFAAQLTLPDCMSFCDQIPASSAPFLQLCVDPQFCSFTNDLSPSQT